jgi:hypothetical protein
MPKADIRQVLLSRTHLPLPLVEVQQPGMPAADHARLLVTVEDQTTQLHFPPYVDLAPLRRVEEEGLGQLLADQRGGPVEAQPRPLSRLALCLHPIGCSGRRGGSNAPCLPGVHSCFGGAWCAARSTAHVICCGPVVHQARLHAPRHGFTRHARCLQPRAAPALSSP